MKKSAIGGTFSIYANLLYFHINYLRDNFQLFGKIEEDNLPLHYRLGIEIMQMYSSIYGVVDVSYIFKSYPFDSFIELAPIFNNTSKNQIFLPWRNWREIFPLMMQKLKSFGGK